MRKIVPSIQADLQERMVFLGGSRFAVECKTGEHALSPHIKYFRERTNIPHYYQVHLGTSEMVPFSNVTILPFLKFARQLGL